ncbi:hypothetical protein KBW81_07350 [Loktanella salsilacus]|uniref:tetratricopeptide repeat-containing protein n=1 Tax=Loktanella salsilacus TaxID=195913 RepID=UPI0020B8925B|nr:tetratricopeptide repeat-containing protein [Loktanella salsilacus]UTH49559.1 hypothetical protein KBW81_07350 [Loktanella salsilacus]
MPDEKICFVVMGFGKKTDFESGRTLDLDATYEAIIQPAVEENGLRCIRANEILHSGVIDTKMYEMLLRADLVIADISTGNVNAVYELGVRHALRPKSTIVMKESVGRLHFDLNHVNTFQYDHMGDDIGHREAVRAKAELSTLIKASLAETSPDSPVYTFIPTLRNPLLSDEEYEALLNRAEELEETYVAHIERAETAAKDSKHLEAAKYFGLALKMSPGDSYLVQQLALHTYKSKYPSAWLSLVKAAGVLEALSPKHSNDAETLGIAGAIHKNMWFLNDDIETLNLALSFYERGFDLRGDYYNGENAATCFQIRSEVQDDSREALFDRMSARKIRAELVVHWESVVLDDEFDQRSDQMWIFATLANCLFALGETDKASEYEKLFIAEEPAQWALETYASGKEFALSGLDKTETETDN